MKKTRLFSNKLLKSVDLNAKDKSILGYQSFVCE